MMMAGSFKSFSFIELADFADVGQVFHAEGILLFVQEFVDGVVETFRVQAVNLRGVHAQRAVHENRHARQFPRQRELVQHINNLLRAPHRKRRDDDLAVLFQGFQHQPANGFVGVRADGMFAPAVGGFDLQIIHVFHRLRVAENFVVAAAHVAAEQITEFPPAFPHVQHHLRRTENVPGVAERDRHAVEHRKGAVVIEGDELLERLLGVGIGVKRFDRREFLLRAFFGDERRVGLLDLRGIHEHDAGQVARGERAVNVAGVTLLAQVRQIAGMVNVRVAQHHGVHLLRVEGKTAIALDGFLAPALEQAAFEQQLLPLISSRYIEPVVVRVAPKKWICIRQSCWSVAVASRKWLRFRLSTRIFQPERMKSGIRPPNLYGAAAIFSGTRRRMSSDAAPTSNS